MYNFYRNPSNEVFIMSKPAKTIIEYRNYDLPEYFPVLLLCGEQWRISDIPSGILHFHNCLEIGICESDSGTMEFMDERLSFHAGDITIVASNISHTTYSSPGTASKWSYIFVDIQELFHPMFPIDAFDRAEDVQRLINNYFGILPGTVYPEIYSIVLAVVRELQKKEINYQFSVRGLLMSLIVKLLPVYYQQGICATEEEHEKTLVIAPALDYIRENYMQDFSMEYLAGLCHLSPTHFRRLFTSIMGNGPLRYLNRTRIQKAATMLRTTEMPILSISEEVGFQSLSSFNRHFAEDFGKSPKDWRKKAVATQNPSVRKFSGWMAPPKMS